MSKYLYIAEKPSVAKEFAKVLKISGAGRDGYMESEQAIVTWCVGHLVTMSYPERYDPALKKWTFQTLPFLPEKFQYEIIPAVKKQFQIVSSLLNRKDVERIYVCTDSGREGEYIYRLVDAMAAVPDTKEKRRVWIDSQTEEEILRGIQEAKPLDEYDNLSHAAYLRAKEDYLMGINFSRVLSLKYGRTVNDFLKNDKWSAISVGRVMTCVLGMVVKREQEIRNFVKTSFYRVLGTFQAQGNSFEGEWRAVEGSAYFQSKLLYKENGFKEEKDAKELIRQIEHSGEPALVDKVERKKEKKQPPMLFNLAELQNVCSKMFKISPDETLKIAQELYEKKLVTYPRTDARVLSTAVSKEIAKNIGGLRGYAHAKDFAQEILNTGSYRNIAKSKYVNDKQITDHYAIIPTGQGLAALNGMPAVSLKVYEVIVRRFLSIFYPPAEYQKTAITVKIGTESFFSSFKMMVSEGYLKVLRYSFFRDKGEGADAKGKVDAKANSGVNADANADAAANSGKFDEAFVAAISKLRKGTAVTVSGLQIKEGETSPPKRYNSGSLILAMENAGQLIEDEELRAQIKGSGIGTSATRAEILSKLVKIDYLKLNKKTQVITPTMQGELIYYVVLGSIRSMLNPELTASWEKGLSYVAEGTITEEEYMQKLERFIKTNTDLVKQQNNQIQLGRIFQQVAAYYQ